MTMIHVPSNRVLEGELSPVSVGIEGWFTLRARRANGRVTRERKFRMSASFHNLITTLGLNRFGTQTSSNLYRYCHVGTGTTPPADSDTQLVAFLANVTANFPINSMTNSGSPDYYSAMILKWTSAIGALGNNNLSEVGVSGQATNGLLFSRELIRDSEGDPTTFPIASDEQLEVTYELRVYPPLSDVEAEITIGSTVYDTITRGLNINSSTQWGTSAPGSGSVNTSPVQGSQGIRAFSGDLIANTGAINSFTGLLGEATSLSSAAYSNDSFYRDVTANWDITSGNGNIRVVQWRFQCALFQTRYDPVIAKANTQNLSLTQRISWARR